MKMASFLKEKRFSTKPQIDLLMETPFHKEIRICMDSKNVMREHTAPGAIMIMVLEGLVSISSHGETVDLCVGEMIFYDAHVPHSLESHEPSVLRLSLSKNDTFKRVAGLV